MSKKRKRRSGFPETESPTKPTASPGQSPPRRWGLLIMFLVISIGGTYLAIWLRPKTEADRYTFKVIKKYDHDSAAFTQGLVMHDGFLWESTGRYGESTIRKTRLETGEVLASYDLDDKYFGEGLTVIGDRFFQLTWKAERGFIYKFEDDKFVMTKEFTYEGEGWGLATDGTDLILSDGSREIKFLDPDSFQVKRSIWVKLPSGGYVGELNELEYYQGKLYANRYRSNLIYEIDPDSGLVTKVIDMKGLWTKRPADAVLNGIAVSPAGKLLVTGKLCPYIFEVSVVRP